MKYFLIGLTISLIILFVATSCSSKKNAVSEEDTITRKGVPAEEQAIVEIKTKYLNKKWRHVKTKDNYDGEWKDVPSEEAKVIEFTGKNEYYEYQKGEKSCEGTYRIEKDNILTNHSCNKVELSHKVRALDKNSLTLGMRGRHGEVLYVYEKIK